MGLWAGKFQSRLNDQWSTRNSPNVPVEPVLKKMDGESDEAGSLGYSINVYPNGNIYPCHLLRFPEFIAGNIVKQPIAKIYHASRVFRASRSWGIQCCQQVENPRATLSKLMQKQREAI